MEIEKTALFQLLKSQDQQLAVRIQMIREQCEHWLSLIRLVFPHYPSHGIDHSDRIINQLSRLLFHGKKPTVGLSSMEAYCLMASSLTHDMGMVISPEETGALLKSEEWNGFTSPGGPGFEDHTRYKEAQQLAQRTGTDLDAFVASRALTFLVADYVRRDHHFRSKSVLELHPFLKQLVDLDDPIVFETISDIGVAHGLDSSELEDELRFPEERDVLDAKVNVRFLARLLRIGDLLDVATRRVDPLTSIAVGPLPSGSIPHWQQYSYIRDENITPNEIRFRFECRDQGSHRVLRDWFGYLEKEIQATAIQQLRSSRHGSWRTPKCKVASLATPTTTVPNDVTIRILPSRGSRYTFHDWRLQIDQNLIFDRLIYDVYSNPIVFVRELLQNSLDATRCQALADHPFRDSGEPNTSTTSLTDSILGQYPVVLSLEQREVAIALDGPLEKRLVFSIVDSGLGMDEDIIKKYFLQVGRSYYQSNEFKSKFSFVPTSRFGVGFLSVFAVSNDVTVYTARKVPGEIVAAGLKLKLQGPRNYLLTEPWNPMDDIGRQSGHGTRIEVVLDNWPTKDSLLEVVRKWCVAVEFPIVVRENGSEAVVMRQRHVDGVIVGTSPLSDRSAFIRRVFTFSEPGIEGELVLNAYSDELGEAWCDCWPTTQDVSGRRMVQNPCDDDGFVALHGLRLFAGSLKKPGEVSGDFQWNQYTDIRSDFRIPLSRGSVLPYFSDRMFSIDGRGQRKDDELNAVINRTAERAVVQHLESTARLESQGGIYYLGQVLSSAPVRKQFRYEYPNSIVTWDRGEEIRVSCAEFMQMKRFVIAAWKLSYDHNLQLKPMLKHPRRITDAGPIVSMSDIPDFSIEPFIAKIRGATLIGLRTIGDMWLFEFTEEDETLVSGISKVNLHNLWLVSDTLQVSAMYLMRGMKTLIAILNADDAVVEWIKYLDNGVLTGAIELDYSHVYSLWTKLADARYEVNGALQRWHSAPGLPDEALPTEKMMRNGFPFKYVEVNGRRTLPMFRRF